MRVTHLLLVALLVLPLDVIADDDWFTIEVIVFEHRDGGDDEEEFPRNPGSPDLLATARLVPPTIPLTLRDFEQLDPETMQLAGAWRSLQRSSRYTPLVMVGWTQLVRAPGQALPVAIDVFTGEPVEAVPLELPEAAIDADAMLPAEDDVEELELDPAPELAEPPMAEQEKPTAFMSEEPTWLVAERLLAQYLSPLAPEQLRGTVRLHLQRFLHVELDLTVATNEPLPPEEDIPGWYERRDTILDEVRLGLLDETAATERLDALQRQPQVVMFRLRESRQLRSGEVHYFDHPRLGAIVTVRPLSSEEREQREQNLIDAITEAEPEPEPEPELPESESTQDPL